MKKSLLLIFLAALAYVASAQEEAVTTSGKKVILYPDGTWKVAAADVPATVKIPQLELPKINPADQIIEHTGFTLCYDPKYKQARWVAYELTESETNPEVERNNAFKPDPLVKSGSAENSDYLKSGYDKGHLAPAADMSWSEQTMFESFYFSNISPQKPGFNRGIWKKLEEKTRLWAIENQALYVVTAGVLEKGLPTIGADKVAVPRYFYKVILDYTGPDVKGIGFILENESSDDLLQYHAVTIDSVEKVTNIDFFNKLPDNLEKNVESHVNISEWTW